MRPMSRDRVRAVLSLLELLEGYAAMLAYSGVAALLIGDVLAREVLGVPVLGSQSIAVLAAIVAGFLGLSLATAKGVHLRPAAFDQILPARFDPFLARGADVVAAVFYAAMTVFAIRFVMESHAAGDRAAVLYFSLWPVQLVMPYAFLSCAIRHAAYALAPGIRPQPGATG